MLLYRYWQKSCEVYIKPAKRRKYKYIYNIIKETVHVTLFKYKIQESIYSKSGDSLKTWDV